jgi:hypothetical protein
MHCHMNVKLVFYFEYKYASSTPIIKYFEVLSNFGVAN